MIALILMLRLVVERTTVDAASYILPSVTLSASDPSDLTMAKTEVYSGSVSGSWADYNPMLLQTFYSKYNDLNTNTCDGSTTYDWAFDYDTFKTKWDAYDFTAQANVINTGSSNNQYFSPADYTSCASSEFMPASSVTVDELIVARQYQFGLNYNPGCFGSYENDGATVTSLGKVAIVGDFTSGSAAATFVSEFRTAFYANVLPDGYNDRYLEFDTEKELNTFVFKTDSTKIDVEWVCAAIVFTEIDSNKYAYKIRFPQIDSIGVNNGYSVNTLDPTFAFRRVSRALGDNYNKYLSSGYASLQLYVDNYILEEELGSSVPKMAATFAPMQTQKYNSDLLLSFLAALIMFLLSIAYCPTVVSVVVTLVKDKEYKQREGMAMMGMDILTYYSSFFCFRLLIGFFQAILMAIELQMVLFPNSEFFALVFAIYFIVILTVCYSFMVSTVFDSSRSAAIVSSIAYFGSFFAILFVGQQGNLPSFKRGISMLPTMYTFYQLTGISNSELDLVGMSFGNMNEDSEYAFQGALIGSIAMLLMTAYLEFALPKQYGTSYGPFFLFKKEFWFEEYKSDAFEYNNIVSEHYEETGEFEKQQEKSGNLLQIGGLTKDFGAHRAVSSVNLKIYENEIFALLGHNGAGKTTTINMISGLLVPTSGQGRFKDFNIFNDITKLRSTLGVCPQLDVLFEDMTVEEHLDMFYIYKNPLNNFLLTDRESYNKEAEVEKWLDNMNLREYRYALSQNLSGGTKRRLSVAIACIADSKLVLLDEPSSGMDLTSRYQLWDILKSLKKDRTIILTTHYMDEADYLGDKIAIMGEGQIRCCGSSSYLKNIFGEGYKLDIETVPEISHIAIKEFIEPKAKFRIIEESYSKLEIEFEKNAQNISEIFNYLDQNKKSLGILNYAIGASNLEDVFLKVAEINSNHTKITQISEDDIKGERKLDFWSFMTHFNALIQKRIRYYSRDWFAISCEIFLPILCILVGCLMTEFAAVFNSNQPRINYSAQAGLNWTNDVYSNFLGSSAKIYALDYTGIPSNTFYDETKINAIYDGYNSYYSGLNVSKNSTAVTVDATYAYANAVSNATVLDDFMFADFDKNFGTNSEPKWGISFYNTEDTTSYMAVVNSRYDQAIPYIINWTTNAVLQANSSSIEIVSYNHPLIQTNDQELNRSNGSNFWFFFFLMMGTALIPVSGIVFIIKEREAHVKYQQFISGVSLFGYWVSNLFWDLVKYVFTLIFWLIIINAYIPNLTSSNYSAFNATILAFLSFGFMTFWFIYVFSFLFENLLKAMIAVLTYFMALGILCYIGYTTMVLLVTFNVMPQDVFDIIDTILCILVPSYNLIKSLTEINTMIINNSVEFEYDAWDSKITKGIIIPIVMGFVYMIVLRTIELSGNFSFTKCLTNDKVFPKVENKKIIQQKTDLCDPELATNKNTVLLGLGLSKTYHKLCEDVKPSVSDIHIKCDKRECLAILGTNGAGKSTTFKMIVGQVTPDSGKVFISGKDIYESYQIGGISTGIPQNMDHARRVIGYCPQEMSIIDLLTAREHLELYGKLKYLDGETLHRNIETLLDVMNLRMNGDLLAGQYSGGNKRKLMVAVAMIGNPDILFLDEPSAGMDPEAKRFMWNALKNYKLYSSIVLTTHSMDEAESLADNIVIMKASEFIAYGSVSSLKVENSTGLYVDIMLNTQEKNIQGLKEKLNLVEDKALTTEGVESIVKNNFGLEWAQLSKFGNGQIIRDQLESSTIESSLLVEYLAIIVNIQLILSTLKAEYNGCPITCENIGLLMKVNVKSTDITCGKLFEFLEKHKEELSISYYNISMAQMVTVFRNIVEDAKSNSSNDCTYLYNSLKD